MHENHSVEATGVRRRRLWTTLIIATIVLVLGGAAAWHGRLSELERAAFDAINGMDWAGVTVFARIVSDTVWLAVIIVALLFLFVKRARITAWRVGAAAVATYLLTYAVEHIVGRARPDILLQSGDVVTRALQNGYGYPSGHTAVMAIVILMIWPLLAGWQRVIAVSLVILVGWSRLYLGVHFPLDIVGGIAVAVIVYCAMALLPESWRVRAWLSDKASK